MAITVPAGDRSHALTLQNQITALPARPDAVSQQAADAKRRDLVHTLIDQRKLDATTILAAVSYPSTHPLALKVTALVAEVAALRAAGGRNENIARGIEANELEAARRQLVSELMASAVVTPATLLAHPSLSYVGGPTGR
jgi:hypothetical protein